MAHFRSKAYPCQEPLGSEFLRDPLVWGPPRQSKISHRAWARRCELRAKRAAAPEGYPPPVTDRRYFSTFSLSSGVSLSLIVAVIPRDALRPRGVRPTHKLSFLQFWRSESRIPPPDHCRAGGYFQVFPKLDSDHESQILSMRMDREGYD